MRDVNGRFKKGNNGGPGRPPGSRNSLGDDFVAAIHVDWREHGAAVLQEVRNSSPAAYLRVVASLVPRQISVDTRDDFTGVSDQELMAQLADCLADAATQLNVPELAQAIKITMKKFPTRMKRKIWKMSDPQASDVLAWILSDAVDSTGEYARSGRKHRNLSDETLVHQWVEAFRAVTKDFTNSALWQAESDLGAEFTLRHQTPPWDLIAVELDQLGSTMMLTLERMMSAGYECSEESFNRFLAFVAEKNRPKN